LGAHGEGYLRFSYAASAAAIKEAIGRIGDWLKRQGLGSRVSVIS